MIEQKLDGSLEVTELMGDFREKLLAAIEDPTNNAVEVVKLEKLQERIEALQKNPPTPESKPSTWINQRAGYVMNGNVATFIKSKATYSIDSNGVWRRISKRRHE